MWETELPYYFLNIRFKNRVKTLQTQMNPNECVWRFGISFTHVIESIDSKLISVCLINDYSIIADLHKFVYGRAECDSIPLECTKVKLLILNNFGYKKPSYHIIPIILEMRYGIITISLVFNVIVLLDWSNEHLLLLWW